MSSAGGILLTKRDFVVWDDPPIRVLEKMVRGLYFHHFGEILGDRADVSVEQITQLTRAKVDSIKLWQCNCVGDGQFVYRYARANDVPLRSAWLLVFHGSLVVLGQSQAVDENGQSGSCSKT